jgi:hypothetical protein
MKKAKKMFLITLTLTFIGAFVGCSRLTDEYDLANDTNRIGTVNEVTDPTNNSTRETSNYTDSSRYDDRNTTSTTDYFGTKSTTDVNGNNTTSTTTRPNGPQHSTEPIPTSTGR